MDDMEVVLEVTPRKTRRHSFCQFYSFGLKSQSQCHRRSLENGTAEANRFILSEFAVVLHFNEAKIRENTAHSLPKL